MNILVAIANFGTKNEHYLKRLIDEYRSMTMSKVDFVVLSNIPKDLGSDVEVVVGLPAKDPWSLPFGHKKVFAERANMYDLFIYTEDDTLITEKNIRSFLEVTQILPENVIAGFMRFEFGNNGKKSISTVHAHYHWKTDSVLTIGNYTFAQFTNDHAGCYILTQKQLKKAIDSRGYLVPPHQGKYDLLCSAATDPYTQCGFTKMICISHFDDFLLHHLPNRYVGAIGLDYHDVKKQLEYFALMDGSSNEHRQLLPVQTDIQDPGWNKSYYESCIEDILDYIPDNMNSVLSIGCGWGVTEAKLLESGAHVVGIPLDDVIAVAARSKGIEVVDPDLDNAFNNLSDRRFDCILICNVLQHLPNPVELLSKCRALLNENGIVFVSVPNLNLIKLLRNGFKKRYPVLIKNNFQKNGIHFTTKKVTEKWLQESGFNVNVVNARISNHLQQLSHASFGLVDSLLAFEYIFVASKK